MRDTGDIEIGFGGTDRKGFTICRAKRIFEQANSTLNESSMTVEIVPMLGTARNTGVKAKVFVSISVNAPAVRFWSTGSFTGTSGRFGNRFGFMADEFKAFRAIFASANASKNKRGFINRTYRSAIVVEIGVSGRSITGIKRNADPLEVEIITEHSVNVIFIKRRIAEESRVIAEEVRVSGKKIQKDGFERGRIADFFIKVRVIGFL